MAAFWYGSATESQSKTSSADLLKRTKEENQICVENLFYNKGGFYEKNSKASTKENNKNNKEEIILTRLVINSQPRFLKDHKMKKVVLKKQVLDSIIKTMSKKQNSKHKLNAGQLREVVQIFLQSLVEMPLEDKALLINSLTK